MNIVENKFSVVHVAETIRGGIASYLREILPRQVQRFGYGQVACIVPLDQIEDLGSPAGVVLVGVKRGGSRFLTAWRARRRLVKLIAGVETDVLHLHSSFAGAVCRVPFLAPRGMRRVVYCPHGWAFMRDGWSGRIFSWLERRLSNRCAAIVCVSESERRAAAAAGIEAAKLHVIYNGLPDRSMSAVAESDDLRQLRLVFVGRLDHQKGFDVLLDALSQVKRPVIVDVFGEAVLERTGLIITQSSVRVHGWQSFNVIEDYLQRCDAVVMPSRWEGMPVSAIEAMRAGKALIASSVGGLVEQVEDGVSGYLLPPSDVMALADVIEHSNREILREMGLQGRQKYISLFQIERCEELLAHLYAG